MADMTKTRFNNPLVCHECGQAFGRHDLRQDVLTNEADGDGIVRYKIHVACIQPHNERANQPFSN
jgi:hypothetical protein